MSTRGAVGYRIDGKDKLAYNHSDSYPSYLGRRTLQHLRGMLKDEHVWIEKARALRVVDGDTEPDVDDIMKLAPFTDTNVGNQSTKDWYCLTRGYQGDTALMLEAGIIVDYAGFMLDSLFCEWAWVINCDDRTFEAYKGFQTRRHSKGRYAPPPDWRPAERYSGRKYYPVALVHAWSWDALPSDTEFAKFWQRRKHWF